MIITEKTRRSIPKSINREAKRIKWWSSLEDQWKWAFNEGVFGKHKDHKPTNKEILDLWQLENLRFVGPTGLYPNLSFELTNVSGLGMMHHLKVLVASFHKIEDITPISELKNLQSLFLHNNAITDIVSIKNMTGLVDLYIQNNKIISLAPLRRLTNLKTCYVLNNFIRNFDGITEKHVQNLKRFYALPNDSLPFLEVRKLEDLGIECLKG